VPAPIGSPAPAAPSSTTTAGPGSRGRSTPARAGRHGLVGVTIAGALMLGGCGAGVQAGGSPSQVSSWMTQSGEGASIGQVQADAKNVDLTLSDHNSSGAVKTVCALLSNDALTAIGNLPSPDSTLTNDLNTAFEDGAAAGKSCYEGAAGNASLLRRSATQRAKLAGLVTVAVDRVEAITGHSPSTSTTLAPDTSDDPFG
jgi:hypothetical protein